LIFWTESEERRNDWLMLLRYGIRNARELGTVSRKEGDPIRGNIHIARLMDHVADLNNDIRDLKAERDRLKEFEKEREVQRVKEREIELNKVQLLHSQEVEKLKSELNHVQQHNMQLLHQYEDYKQEIRLRAVSGILNNSIQPATNNITPTQSGHNTPTKLTPSSSSVSLVTPVENNQSGKMVIRRNSNGFALLTGSNNSEQDKDNQQSQNDEVTFQQTELEVAKLHREVLAAEKVVKRKSRMIRQAMVILAERDKALQSTTTAMQFLQPQGTSEPALQKLEELKESQREMREKAEKILQEEYEAMAIAAESLNAKNELYHAKVLEKEKRYRQTLVRYDNLQSTQGHGQASAAKELAKRKQDEGCIIS